MCTFKILMHINTYLCIVLHISRAFETKYAKICKYMTKYVMQIKMQYMLKNPKYAIRLAQLLAPWSTARDEITPQRRPKLQILNLGLLCCWRGTSIFVYILGLFLASTSPLRAQFRVYALKNSCLIRCMGNLIGSLKIKETDFVVSTSHPNCQFLGNFQRLQRFRFFPTIKHAIFGM